MKGDKIVVNLPVGADREAVRRAFRDIRESTESRRRSKEEIAGRMIQVDAQQWETLLRVAVTSASLLPYTEQMAAAARPNEFVELAENLARLAPLLEGEKGAGRVIDGLMDLLRDLES